RDFARRPAHPLEVPFCEVRALGEDTDLLVGPDHPRCDRYLEQRRGKDRHVDARGELALEDRQEPAAGRDGRTPSASSSRAASARGASSDGSGCWPMTREGPAPFTTL